MSLHHVQLKDESSTLLRELAERLEMPQSAVIARALRALKREEDRLAAEPPQKQADQQGVQ